MGHHLYRSLAKISPRPRIIYCSQGRAVLATDLDGFIGDFPRHGLFVGETRVLSRCRYFVDGRRPETVAVSNVEQHSWLGYYISPAPGADWKQDTGSGEMEEASEETIELKVSRTIGLGVHEDRKPALLRPVSESGRIREFACPTSVRSLFVRLHLASIPPRSRSAQDSLLGFRRSSRVCIRMSTLARHLLIQRSSRESLPRHSHPPTTWLSSCRPWHLNTCQHEPSFSRRT